MSKSSMTQVGSPAVRLRLARCTAWVKRWSEAMDFLQTIFKTNIFLLRIFENSQKKPSTCQHMIVAVIFRARKLLQNLWQIYESISRFVIDPISITYSYMLQPTLGLENRFKIYGKYMSLYKISNWPNIYYLHVAANFRAGKLFQILWQKYEPV